MMTYPFMETQEKMSLNFELIHINSLKIYYQLKIKTQNYN